MSMALPNQMTPQGAQQPMNKDPRSWQGIFSRGANTYTGLPSAPGAGRPLSQVPVQQQQPGPGLGWGMDTIRQKLAMNQGRK